MTEPRWLSVEQVLWLHALQMREFGGLPGVRDIGLVDSALTRVRQRFHYGELKTIPEVAVAYAVSSTRIILFWMAINELGSIAYWYFFGCMALP